MTTPEAIAFERGLRPAMQILLPDQLEAILQFQPPEELWNRLDILASKSTEGQLTDPEKEEYEGYVRANKFVAILQRQARQMAGLP